MSSLLHRLAGEEDGASTAEYVLLAFFVGATLVAIVGSFGDSVSSLFSKACAVFPVASPVASH